jgi:tetraacyldisaccharide 4'-kinase
MTEKTATRLERLFFFGRPLSPLYGFLMTVRSNFYRWGFLRQRKLETPVVSVGNLVLGGTGKTPLVHYIARLLQQHHAQPAILSRGYGGAATAAINVVADRQNIMLDAAAAGDEPRLLAEKLPGVPVITGKKRYAAGRFAIDTLGAEVLILDDGFQHMALQRDLNLVLFNGLTCLGNGRVLPGGELREPVAALQRADAFIISNVGSVTTKRVRECIAFLQKTQPETPVFTTSYRPAKTLIRLHQGKSSTISPEAAATIPLYGFCGIAAPASFRNTLLAAGLNLRDFEAYADHYPYSAGDIETLCSRAEGCGAAGLITTEKDLVKVRHLLPAEFPLLVLPIELDAGEDLDLFLRQHLAKLLPSFSVDESAFSASRK